MLTELPPQFQGGNLAGLVKMLERQPGLTTRELAKRCGVSLETMADVMDFLERTDVAKAVEKKAWWRL